jgi:hypothetical protein
MRRLPVPICSMETENDRSHRTRCAKRSSACNDARRYHGQNDRWHSLRPNLATNLRELDVEVEIAQKFLRHASSRITMDADPEQYPSRREKPVAKSLRRCWLQKRKVLKVSTPEFSMLFLLSP